MEVIERSTPVTNEDILAARPAVSKIARRTPMLPAPMLSEEIGGTVLFKAENLQLTGSFKVRGAAAKLAALDKEDHKTGVVTASAGNHGQGLAAAARVFGVGCEVFVPEEASLSKIEATRAQGAVVHINGPSIEECIAAAREHERSGRGLFVHPFDDPHVVAGQGSIGLELLEDVPDLAKVVIPIGGGGLASGIAIAVKSAKPEVEVIGVEAAVAAPYLELISKGRPAEVKTALTIADGIAVKKPGELTTQLLSQWLDGIEVVSEDQIADAMVMLMQRSKIVVEGAGAVGVAALVSGKVTPAASGSTVVIVSGGNVDAGLLAAASRRHETQAGRRLVLLTRVADRPGALAKLLSCLAKTNANIVETTHVREGLELHIRETAVELVLETRDQAHAQTVVELLNNEGYETRILR